MACSDLGARSGVVIVVMPHVILCYAMLLYSTASVRRAARSSGPEKSAVLRTSDKKKATKLSNEVCLKA